MTDFLPDMDLEPNLVDRLERLTPEQRARLERLVRDKLDRGGEIPAADGPGPWPASLAQERMWLGSDVEPGANIDATVVRLRGHLALPALRAALVRIVQRHEALRTTFELTGEVLVQLVDPRPRVPVSLVDLTALALDIEPGVPELVGRLARDSASRVFDLARGPLLRVVVFRLSAADHCVLLAIHHAVTDGWSQGVLAGELTSCYRDLLAGRAWSAPPLKVHYKDYAGWQRTRHDGPETETLERFWNEMTQDLPRMDLPADAPRGTDAGGPHRRTGADHRLTLDPDLSADLAALRRTEGGSWFMLILAGLLAVLRSVTGQSDLVVGTIAAGRSRPELEGLVGCFVNVLPLRFRLPPDPTFRQLWAVVREQALAAYAHQELPYETLLRMLRAERLTGQAAPFRVMCVPHATTPEIALPGLVAETYDVDLGYSLFDLVATVTEQSTQPRVTFQYDTEVFTGPAIRQLGGYLRRALARAAADPDLPCSALLSEPGRTAGPPISGGEPTLVGLSGAATMHGPVEAQAARTPDAIALVDGERQLSYRALNARANQLARHLVALGVRPEDRVGVCLPRSAAAVTALLAVLKAGAAYLPLDPGHPQDRLAELVADAGIRSLITTSSLGAGAWYEGDAVLLDTDQQRIVGRSGADLRLPVHPEQAAYLIYTSGSTGRPKGVVGLHGGMANRITWMARTYPVGRREVCAVRTSLTFGDSMWEIFGPLAAGAVLAVIPETEAADPVQLVDRLALVQVSRIVVVPALVTMLLDGVPDLGRRLSGLRTWCTSGEEIRANLVARFHRTLPGARLLNLYGSSEVSADATVAEVLPAGPVRVPIGRPIGGVSVWVGDQWSRRLPALVPGEIRIGGRGVGRGYHNRAAETAAVFVPDPYGPPGGRSFRSGDLARQWTDGRLEYLGRRDVQVQIRGHRVEPGEVEEALLKHPAVIAATVTAQPDPADSVTLVGYLVPGSQPLDAARLDEIRAFLHRRLPPYLVPSILVPVDALPRTAGGKIDRRSLRVPRPGAAVLAPRGHTEGLVATAFAEVLGVEEVGRDEDFFLVGGHSLLASRLVRLLTDRLGRQLRLADLFEAPTVAALAAKALQLPVEPDPEVATLRPDPARWLEPFALTEVQASYYVGRRTDLHLGGVSTQSYLEVAVTDLDLDRFSEALRALIQRHQMLRSVLRPDGTQQVLADVPPYEVTTYDLRQLSAEEEQGRLRAVRDEMSHQLLGPYTWPLFDVRVSLLPSPAGTARVLVHISVDSLICDAYSFLLIMDELTTRYYRSRDDFPELEVAFRDYVVHQSGDSTAARRAVALDYWRRRLPELPGGPELPLRAVVGERRFVRRSGRLAAPLWSALKERGTGSGLTPSGVLLGAFTEVITSWSRQPRYTVMLTVFNRDPVHPQINDVVGDFTSLTALEVDHSSPAPFVDRARAVQHRLWSDLDHAAVSAATVAREWTLSRGLLPQSISPVVFTSNLPFGEQTAGATPTVLGDLVYGLSQTPQVQLDHQVGELRGELIFNWDSVDGVFAPAVLDDMFAAYQALIARLATDPGAWSEPYLAPLPVDVCGVRATTNDTAGPLPSWCLHEAVNDAARRDPDRVAVIAGPVRMTYAELTARARRVAHTVRALGAGRNTLVAVAAQGWQQVVATLGVLEAGAAFLPLDHDLPAERFALLIERGEVSVLLSQAALLGKLPPLAGVRFIAVDDETGLYPDDEPVAAGAQPADLAYVIFTSGSTGEPKGVMIDHRGAANTVAWVNRQFQVGADDRVLAVSSPAFDLSVYDVFGVLSAGGAVVLPDRDRRRQPGHWAQLIRDERVTVWNSVPALAELLTDQVETLEPDALASVRLVMLSGDWIPVTLPERIRTLTGGQLVSLGGATEASIWSVWYPIERVEPSWRSIPYGKPIDNQSLFVLDRELLDRPDWVAGDLYIGGVGLAQGYWRDQELTDKSFVIHPETGRRLYRTGDLARYLPDGNLEFLGRIDGQVKINGFRIETEEVVAGLNRINGVRAAAVISVDAAGGGRRLVACLVPELRDGRQQVDLDGVRRRLVEILPSYMVPTGWVALDQLPLTANGKVDSDALRRLAARHPATSRDADPLGSPAVSQVVPDQLISSLCELWQELLAVESVRPQDGFFALGGTSLVAIRMLTRLQQSFGVNITLPDVFRSPTVAALAELITEQRRTGEPSPPLPTASSNPGERHEPFPLTEVQQAYWIGRQSGQALGGVATHCYYEMDVTNLDLSLLESALGKLIRRHDALRSIVRPDGRQQVLQDVPRLRIPAVDLRGIEPSRALVACEAVRAEMSHQLRDLGQWPLFELRGLLLDEARTRLCVSFDLMMVDARSMQILTSELLMMYADRTLDLPALGLTFRDYVIAADQMRRTKAFHRARHYWKERLSELPPPPDLPLLSSPEKLIGSSFARLNTELQEPTWQLLRTCAADAGITPTGLLCSAFCSALATWTGVPRFTLNLTTFNRLPVHPDVDDLVGDFTATTLLEVDYAGQSFLDDARRIQRQIWEDLEHRLVTGVEVQRMLRRHPAARNRAMMPVVFTSTLLPEGMVRRPPVILAAAPVYGISQTPQVLLDVQVAEDRGRLQCSWDYVPAAFPPDLIETMFGAFERTLAALAAEMEHVGNEPEVS
ncbi:amino acid adenylation domain-containing protein [Kribbella sp. NBC_01505]|uniref:amino acid adenylation domain-containing protein n=1 Tax=Kribbella sp. NBC_01505 TaxID=2903580 RepID=UPI00386CE84E